MVDLTKRGAIGLAALLAAATVLLAVVAVRHLREEPPPPPPPVHLVLPMPPSSEAGTHDEPLDAAISPDEREIVFVASTSGVPRLWRQSIDRNDPELIEGTEGARLPAWKATGQVVSFFANGRLKQVSLADGQIGDLAGAPAPAGATWLPDGSLLFSPDGRGPIRRLLGGRLTDATVLAPGDRAHVLPIATGEGNEFVYVAIGESGRRVARLKTAGGEHELVESSHAQLIRDYLLYLRDGVLFGQRFDRASLTLAGDRRRHAAVGVADSGRGMFVASPRLLLTARGGRRPRTPTWFDAEGRPIGPLTDADDYWQVRLSPDDRYAALTVTDRLLGTLDVVIVPTTGAAVPRKLSLALAGDLDPVWSPDSTRVLFRSLQDVRPRLFVRRVEPFDAPAESFRASELEGVVPTDWRTSGGIVLQVTGRTTGADLWALDPDQGARRLLATGGFNETDGRWSPDGRGVAYVSDESGRPDIYVEVDGTRTRVSSAGGSRPRWARDGSLLFLRGAAIMRTDRVGAHFAPPRPVVDLPGVRDFDTARRSDRFLALVPAPATEPARIEVVVNWKPGGEGR